MRMITLRLNNDHYTQLHREAESAELSLNAYCLRKLGFNVDVAGKPRGRKRRPPVNSQRLPSKQVQAND